MNKSNLNDYIVNISNTSYKFTKATVFKADKAIAHIKKYKKIYKYTVVYLALCLAPQFAQYGKYLIHEFMVALANQPTDMIIEWVYRVFLQFAKYYFIVAGLYNLVKINFTDLCNELKRKYL